MALPFIEPYYFYTTITILTESKTIVVMEPNTSGHVISAFNNEKLVNQIVLVSEKKIQNFLLPLVSGYNDNQLYMIPFNKKNKVVLYSKCFSLKFQIWDY